MPNPMIGLDEDDLSREQVKVEQKQDEECVTSSQSSLVTRARKPIRVQRSFFFVKNRLKSFFKSTDGRPSSV